VGYLQQRSLRNLLQLFLEIEVKGAHDYLSEIFFFAAVRTMEFTHVLSTVSEGSVDVKQ
jgi:hypothetical protein